MTGIPGLNGLDVNASSPETLAAVADDFVLDPNQYTKADTKIVWVTKLADTPDGMIAREDGNGWMGTILREPGDIYHVRYDKAPLEKVANSERFFPEEWIAESRVDVTDDFIKYAMPLIGVGWPSIPMVNGLQRFARFERIFADQKLGDYVPQTYR